MKWLLLALGLTVALLVVSVAYDLMQRPQKTILTITYASNQFPEVGVGGFSELEFTVNNPTDEQISGSVTDVSFPFQCASGCSFALEPGESVAVTIEFRPRGEGEFRQTVRFKTERGEMRLKLFATARSKGKPWKNLPHDPHNPPRNLKESGGGKMKGSTRALSVSSLFVSKELAIRGLDC